MREYQIFFKDGNHQTVDCESKKALIYQFFDNDEEKFKKEVSRIIYSVQTSQFVEDVSTSKTSAQVNCSDVNPYGWRK